MAFFLVNKSRKIRAYSAKLANDSIDSPNKALSSEKNRSRANLHIGVIIILTLVRILLSKVASDSTMVKSDVT